MSMPARTVAVKINKFKKKLDLLYRTTNAQHTHINNTLYIVGSPTWFDASASSSGSLILLLYKNH
jgi:hypothetical protein